MLAEKRLRGGPDAQALRQLLAAAMGDPGDFRSKALNMILLPLEQRLGDEHGHGHVDMARFLEATIQIVPDPFPQGIAVGLDDHEAFDRGIIGQFGFPDDVRIPLGEIHLHIGDLFYFLFAVIVCHHRSSQKIVKSTSQRDRLAGGTTLIDHFNEIIRLMP